MPIRIDVIGPPTTLGPGASISENYWFGDQVNIGVCYATVATDPTFKAKLTQTNQGRVGMQKLIGGVWHPELTAWEYTVTTRNHENYSVAFNLEIAILTRG